MPRWTFFLLALVSLSLTSAGKKTPSDLYLLTVHLEASENEAPKFATPVKLGPENRQYYFKKVPEFNDTHVTYFYPFTSKDGLSYGAAFKLRPTAADHLRGLSQANVGRLLGFRLQPNHYSAVYIDRAVSDGIIVIWDGLAKEHIQELSKRFPHAGQFQQAAGGAAAAP